MSTMYCIMSTSIYYLQCVNVYLVYFWLWLLVVSPNEQGQRVRKSYCNYRKYSVPNQ